MANTIWIDRFCGMVIWYMLTSTMDKSMEYVTIIIIRRIYGYLLFVSGKTGAT